MSLDKRQQGGSDGDTARTSPTFAKARDNGLGEAQRRSEQSDYNEQVCQVAWALPQRVVQRYLSSHRPERSRSWPEHAGVSCKTEV